MIEQRNDKVRKAEAGITSLGLLRLFKKRSDAVSWIQEATLSDWWLENTDALSIKLKYGRKRVEGNIIYWPRKPLRIIDVLHMMAHVVSPDSPSHGRKWARTLLAMVKAWGYRRDWREMRKLFDQNKVKFRVNRRPTSQSGKHYKSLRDTGTIK